MHILVTRKAGDHYLALASLSLAKKKHIRLDFFLDSVDAAVYW